jgi:4-alpha-glucanotransferase
MVAFFEGGRAKILADTSAGTHRLGRQPYQSFSAFAISSYYVDLDTLIEQGLLSKDEVEVVHPPAARGKKSDAVNYAALYRPSRTVAPSGL